MNKQKRVFLQNLVGIVLLVGGGMLSIPFFLQGNDPVGYITTAVALIGLVLVTLAFSEKV